MSSGSLPTLTRAESDIMQVLWALERGTVHDVVAALDRDVAYTTVLTMLRILEKKGYVRHEPAPEGGRAYVYSPAVVQDKARKQHVKDLVQRLFAGNVQELVAGLVDEEKMTREELEALRAKIDARLRSRDDKGKKR
jgi:predicted transcriptional regulator